MLYQGSESYMLNNSLEHDWSIDYAQQRFFKTLSGPFAILQEDVSILEWTDDCTKFLLVYFPLKLEFKNYFQTLLYCPQS